MHGSRFFFVVFRFSANNYRETNISRLKKSNFNPTASTTQTLFHVEMNQNKISLP